MRTSRSYPDLVEEELKKYDGEVCKYFQVDRRSSMVSLSKKSVEDFLNYCNFFDNCKSNSFLVCLTWFLIPGTMEPRNLKDHFTILQKCKNKLDCLLYETLYIGDLDPALNT